MTTTRAERAIISEFETELIEWADRNIAGKYVADHHTLAMFDLMARKMFADKLGLDPSQIELVGLRYEQDGRLIVFDGVEVHGS